MSIAIFLATEKTRLALACKVRYVRGIVPADRTFILGKEHKPIVPFASSGVSLRERSADRLPMFEYTGGLQVDLTAQPASGILDFLRESRISRYARMD